jgi:hypothetical protein
MSKKLVELCEAILEDHFGYYVSVVGRILVASWLPLAFIVRRLADKKLTVREVFLKFLYKNNFFKENSILFVLKDMLVLFLHFLNTFGTFSFVFKNLMLIPRIEFR